MVSTKVQGGPHSPTTYLQTREFRVSRPREVGVIVGGLGLAATALVVQYIVRAYNNWQARVKEEKAQSADTTEEPQLGESVSGSWFARTFYDGGFEEKMSKREAALILGVRETATVQRIKDAHRRILIINHPDTGGSTYVTSKINEAKEVLLKGKQ